MDRAHSMLQASSAVVLSENKINFYIIAILCENTIERKKMPCFQFCDKAI